ncbi:MAG: 5-oxoprolinase subunit PxpB [Balneola sp.]|nr:MAG: 5-oxoprolinase subunit PxpB [Balneola sp.]
MKLPSFQNNGVEWKPSALGEGALLVSPEGERRLSQIHQLSRDIEALQLAGIIDLAPSYNSLCIFFDEASWSFKSILKKLASLPNSSEMGSNASIITVPLCYELGLDWEEVETHTKLGRDEVIEIHSKTEYTVAMMGFIPGFVFLFGLDERISCPRKQSPRTSIPSGSVGIGGNQTGVYSLESPGGWNILGRTPLSFFDINQTPPTQVNPGDTIKFKPISKEEFEDG